MKVTSYSHNTISENGGPNEGFLQYFHCKYFWSYVKHGTFSGQWNSRR